MKKLLIIMTLLCMFSLTGCENNNIYSKYKVTESQKISSTNKKYKEITYDEYDKKIKNENTFIILLYQTGCSHCESFEPKLNSVISNYSLEIYALNLADLSEEQYAKVKNRTFVSGTPTTAYFKDGKYVSKLVGDKEAEEIINFLVDCNYLEEK